jgi:hypothetical protein
MEQTKMSVDELLNMYNSTPQEVEQNRVETPAQNQQPVNEESYDNNTKTVDQVLEENGVQITEQGETVVADNVNVEAELSSADLKAIDLLIQEGKLFPMEDQTGKVIPIKNKKDLIELIDNNNEYFKTQAYTNVEQQIYQTKSPVWQTLLKYAEDARDISEIAPLFNVIQEGYENMQLDTNEPEHQEYIVKMYGALQGLDEQTIEEDIVDLKERGKLADRATKLKPALDQYNEQRIQQVLAKKEQEDQMKAQYLQNHYNAILQNVIQPEVIDGFRFNDQHKQLIASTLVPDPKIGGLPIYAIIDNLLQQGNYNVLSKIALLATDPKSFDNYYTNRVESGVVSGVQKRLRTSYNNQTSSGSVISSSDERQQQRQKTNLNDNQKSNSGFYFSRD